MTGDVVSVTGKVEELGFAGGLRTTQFTKPQVRAIATGHALPRPIEIGRPGRRIPDAVIDDDAMNSFEPRTDAIDFWESVEGMRVEVHDPVVVGPSTGGASDETQVEGNGPDTRLSLSPGRIDPLNPCFSGGRAGTLSEPTRKSLAAELCFRDRSLFVIVNHLKSKRGDDALFGAKQPPALNTEEQRTCQAEAIGRFAASILARDSGAAVVLLGDLNEHEFRRPVRRLEEVSGLAGLIERIPLRDRYTFVFEGNSQVLDHIMVSPSLLAKEAPEIDIVHVNAGRADEDAASDHDPVVARLRM